MQTTIASMAMITRHRRALAAAVVLVLTAGLLLVAPAGPASAATCPCTIWSASTVPGTPADSDTAAVEVGVKFRADTAGSITGIRFYKGTGNSGTHVGHLWSSTGTVLGTVTFTGETATGWQQALFATPVNITAGTTYVASYYAPNGRYSADEGYFTGNTVTNAPLTALADGADGGNGVYRYGTGGGFPNSTFQATNYWVDVVYNTSTPDTTKPTVTDRQPAAGSTGVAVGSVVSATFSESVQQSTIALTVTGGASAMAGALAYNDSTRIATFTPSSALTANTTYTVNVSGTKDTAGNQMDPISWTFTTGSAAGSCPCSIWANAVVPATPAANDNSAVEVGVKFRTNQAGYVTGLRFYKGSGNTGTHVGSLWSSAGSKLASVTFTGETTTGWQQATLAAPVAVAANTTYVASYYAPVGRYAAASNFFASAATMNGPLTALRNGTDGGNGLYKYGASGFPTSTYQSSNYYVDLVFNTTAVDTTAPSLTAQSPAANSTGVAVNSPVTATFSEAIVTGSIAMSVQGPGGNVSATTAYDPGTLTATLTPSAALAYNTSYTASVSGAKDAAGNTMTTVTWNFTTGAQPPPPPDQGPGGPIAVVTSSANPYSKYLAEILRTEGLNEFTTIDVGTLSSTALASYDVVVLGAVTVTAAQASTLSDWINAGGNLIALKPNPSLSALLGLTTAPGTAVTNGYLKVDTSVAPGAGIVADTIQYHGDADRYTLNGAQTAAALYSDAATATGNPAVTLRTVGPNGGQAAAFTFDLARSIVLTRQGNPSWAGQERDSQTPIRSDDMFFGGAQTDWVNLNKVAIPQADEQQRLLTNLIQVMNRDRKPLPRFWYFPRNLKAVVIATGDDHGNGGTAGRFDQYLANSPAGCSANDWTCPRFSSYVYPSTPLSNAAATSYTNQGFEVGVHVQNGCSDFTPSSLTSSYASDLASWKARFTTQPAPSSNRYHCIVYSDWASQPKTELANGMRLEGNYYYWPGTWIQNRPGFMTGSGMPMRFADTDGTMIDVYQAASQMTDESDQVYPFTVNTLLDNALGPLGYYGAFDANMHTDSATTAPSDAVLQSALTRGVPLVSGRQMLTWLDGRNASSYGGVSWGGNTLSFTVSVGTGANGLTGMVPTDGPNGTVLTGLSRAGTAVAFTTGPIKGLNYATFAAAAGSYTATYAPVGAGSGLRSSSGLAAVIAAASASSPAVPAAQASVADSAPPTASDPVVTALPDGTAQVSWTTNEPTRAEIGLGPTATDLSDHGVDAGLVTTHQAVLTDLEPNSTVWVQPSSTDAAGNSVEGPAVPVVVPGPGVADQSWASFKRGTTKGQATIDTTALGSVTLSGSDGKRRTGTFTSGILDAHAMVDWDRMTVHADIPDGATVTVKVRTGSTATPDKTWSNWRSVADSDRVGGPGSRYLQYEVELTAKAKGAAPALRSIGFGNNGAPFHAPGETG